MCYGRNLYKWFNIITCRCINILKFYLTNNMQPKIQSAFRNWKANIGHFFRKGAKLGRMTSLLIGLFFFIALLFFRNIKVGHVQLFRGCKRYCLNWEGIEVLQCRRNRSGKIRQQSLRSQILADAGNRIDIQYWRCRRCSKNSRDIGEWI